MDFKIKTARALRPGDVIISDDIIFNLLGADAFVALFPDNIGTARKLRIEIYRSQIISQIIPQQKSLVIVISCQKRRRGTFDLLTYPITTQTKTHGTYLYITM